MRVKISDLFTEQEVRAALKIWRTDRRRFHDRVSVEIVQPALDRINEATGQENDASFFAYALEFILGSLER